MSERKDSDRTRTTSGSWYLNTYRFKYNHTHLKPFLEALKNKKLIGLRCQGCNTVSFPPKIVCGKCLVKPNRWVSLRETAVIATYSGKAGKPIVAARQDGSDTLWPIKLRPDVNFEDCYIGMPIKVKWREETVGSLDDVEYYEPVEDFAKDLPLRKD